MKPSLSLAVLAFTVLFTATPSHSGSFTTQTRSITAPPGFVPACSRYSWVCSNGHSGHAMKDPAALKLLGKVNSLVNSRVRAVADAGTRDAWTLPTSGKGDCEDFVLAKKKALMDSGFRSDRLSIAVVLDRSGNNHAVLIARLDGGDVVLDNMSRSVKAWDKTGYTYIARQNFDNKRAWQVIWAKPKGFSLFQG